MGNSEPRPPRLRVALLLRGRHLVRIAVIVVSVAAVSLSLVVSSYRLNATKDQVDRTEAVLHAVCVYQHDGTLQGNVRATYQKQIGAALEKSLRTAAASLAANHHAEIAAEFRASADRLEREGAKVVHRVPIICP